MKGGCHGAMLKMRRDLPKLEKRYVVPEAHMDTLY